MLASVSGTRILAAMKGDLMSLSAIQFAALSALCLTLTASGADTLRKKCDQDKSKACKELIKREKQLQNGIQKERLAEPALPNADAVIEAMKKIVTVVGENNFTYMDSSNLVMLCEINCRLQLYYNSNSGLLSLQLGFGHVDYDIALSALEEVLVGDLNRQGNHTLIFLMKNGMYAVRERLWFPVREVGWTSQVWLVIKSRSEVNRKSLEVSASAVNDLLRASR